MRSGERRRLRQPLVGRVREEVAHGTEVCCSPAELRHDGGRTEMAFEELKQRSRARSGARGRTRGSRRRSRHPRTRDRPARSAPGVKWLDLACGTGAVAERAAERGADVTGVDLAPALIETAKERAQERGLDIDYRVGDCERLEFEDGAFDVLSSTCGVMFSPDHQAAAARDRPRGEARRPDRARELDDRRQGHGRHLRGHEAVPAATSGRSGLRLRLGRGAARQGLARRFVRPGARDGSVARSLPDGEGYWELFSTSYGPTKALAEGARRRAP